MLTSRIALALIAISAVSSIALCQSIQINRDNKTIAISTTDEATATADVAAITIGFEIFGSDSEVLFSEGGKLSHAILDALRRAGAKDDSIESVAQGVQRNTDFDEKEKAEKSERETK